MALDQPNCRPSPKHTGLLSYEGPNQPHDKDISEALNCSKRRDPLSTKTPLISFCTGWIYLAGLYSLQNAFKVHGYTTLFARDKRANRFHRLPSPDPSSSARCRHAGRSCRQGRPRPFPGLPESVFLRGRPGTSAAAEHAYTATGEEKPPAEQGWQPAPHAEERP